MSVQPGRMTAVLDYLKSVQREVYGTEEFEYYLFADKVKQMYEADRQTATLYGLFAGIAIVVSCLGLISLATLFWQINRAARINPAEVIKGE